MPRMANGLTYRSDDMLYGESYDEPVSRGPFIQITRLAAGTTLCMYCGSNSVPQNNSDTYGPLMLRLEPDRKNTPVDFELTSEGYSAEIQSAADEWRRAENARRGASEDPKRLARIEEAQSRRFATTVACDACVRISETVNEKIEKPEAA